MPILCVSNLEYSRHDNSFHAVNYYHPPLTPFLRDNWYGIKVDTQGGTSLSPNPSPRVKAEGTLSKICNYRALGKTCSKLGTVLAMPKCNHSPEPLEVRAEGKAAGWGRSTLDTALPMLENTYLNLWK